MQSKFSNSSINSFPLEPDITTIHSDIDSALKKLIISLITFPFWNWTFLKHFSKSFKSLVLFGSYQKTLKYVNILLNTSSYFEPFGNVSSLLLKCKFSEIILILFEFLCSLLCKLIFSFLSIITFWFMKLSF